MKHTGTFNQVVRCPNGRWLGPAKQHHCSGSSKPTHTGSVLVSAARWLQLSHRPSCLRVPVCFFLLCSEMPLFCILFVEFHKAIARSGRFAGASVWLCFASTDPVHAPRVGCYRIHRCAMSKSSARGGGRLPESRGNAEPVVYHALVQPLRPAASRYSAPKGIVPSVAPLSQLRPCSHVFVLKNLKGRSVCAGASNRAAAGALP